MPERRQNLLLRQYWMINQDIDAQYPGAPRLHRPVKFGVDRCFKHNLPVEGCSGWLPMCGICLKEFPGSDWERERWMRQAVESQYVLCPGCAYDEALFEDAQRELDRFLSFPGRPVLAGFDEI